MIIKHEHAQWHFHKNATGAHRVQFWGLEEEVSRFLPNKDEYGWPIAEGSRYHTTNDNNHYTWTGYEWHKDGDGPVPPPPGPGSLVELHCIADHGFIDSQADFTVNVAVNDTITFPLSIDDHKYAYLPGDISTDLLARKLYLEDEDGNKVDVKYDSKTNEISFVLTEANKSYTLRFFGCDYFYVNNLSSDYTEGSFTDLVNCEMDGDYGAITKFIGKHSNQSETFRISLTYTGPKVPKDCKFPTPLVNTEYNNGVIRFIQPGPCYESELIQMSNSTTCVLNPYLGTIAGYTRRTSISVPQTSRCIFPLTEVAEEKGQEPYLWHPKDKSQLLEKLVVTSDDVKVPAVDIEFIDDDETGLAFAIDTEKYQNLDIYYFGADVISFDMSDFDKQPSVVDSTNLLYYRLMLGKHFALSMHNTDMKMVKWDQDIDHFNYPVECTDTSLDKDKRTQHFRCSTNLFDNSIVGFQDTIEDINIDVVPIYGSIAGYTEAETIQVPSKPNTKIVCLPYASFPSVEGFLWGFQRDKGYSEKEYDTKFRIYNNGQLLDPDNYDLVLPGGDEEPGIIIDTSQYRDLRIEFYGADVCNFAITDITSDKWPEILFSKYMIEDPTFVSDNPATKRLIFTHNVQSVHQLTIRKMVLDDFVWDDSSIVEPSFSDDKINTYVGININTNYPYAHLTCDEKEDAFRGLKLMATEDGSTVNYKVTGELNLDIETSEDGENWTKWDGSDITLKDRQYIFVRNNSNTLSLDSDNWFKFNMTGKIEAKGDITSLINFSKLSRYCFYRLFEECSAMTVAPKLPSTTLEYACYQQMFSNCRGITTAPYLPATELAELCYSNMFYNCTKLNSVPDLPATKLARSCCASMFSGCLYITKAPALPATELAYACYDSMFHNIHKLVEPPVLPATTLATYCYREMFSGCDSLKVRETNSEAKENNFFHCDDIPSDWCRNMFAKTGGEFTGDPTSGMYYSWYK